MNKGRFIVQLLTTVVLFLALSPSLYAEPVIAFGLFKNQSRYGALTEFEVRLPVEIIKQLRKNERFEAVYPAETAEAAKEAEVEFKYRYTKKEYEKLCDELDSRYLVTAELNSDGNTVSAIIYSYDVEKDELITLNFKEPTQEFLKTTVLGTLKVFNSLYGEKIFYQKQAIPENARIAFMSYQPEAEQNFFMIELMQAGFQVASFSVSDFSEYIKQESEKILKIQSGPLTQEKLMPYEPVEFKLPLSPIADNQKDLDNLLLKKKNVNDFVYNYTRLQQGVFKKIREAYGSEYLLLVSPQNDEDHMTLQSYDLKTGEPVYYRTGIEETENDTYPTQGIYKAFIADLLQKEPEPVVDDIGGITALEKTDKTGTDEEGELASVAILNFFDRTDTVLYTWMSESLSDAINGSMHKRFEYKRTRAETAQQTGAEVFANVTDIGQLPQSKLFEYKQKTGADYLIFGAYTIDPETSEINIEARIYDLYDQKLIGGTTEKTPANNKMFLVVDIIAGKIVQDIYRMAHAQNTE